MSAPLKPIPLRIKLPFATEEEFLERYGQNLGRGAMFVATRATKPEGTTLAFELVLADGTRLLAGEGVVVKAQTGEDGSRPGMTVRFVRLETGGQVLIDRAVERRAQAQRGTAAEPSEAGAASRSTRDASVPAPRAGVSSSPAVAPHTTHGASLPARATASSSAAVAPPTTAGASLPAHAGTSSSPGSPRTAAGSTSGTQTENSVPAKPSASVPGSASASDTQTPSHPIPEAPLLPGRTSTPVRSGVLPPRPATPLPATRTGNAGATKTADDSDAPASLKPSAGGWPQPHFSDDHEGSESRADVAEESRRLVSSDEAPPEDARDARAVPPEDRSSVDADLAPPVAQPDSIRETAVTEESTTPAVNPAREATIGIDEKHRVDRTPRPDALPAGNGLARTRSTDRLRAILSVTDTAASAEQAVALAGIDLGSSGTRVVRSTDGGFETRLAPPGLDLVLDVLTGPTPRVRCVVALPAGAGTAQRHAIDERLKGAGAEVRRFLHATSAAGLSFASTRQLARQRVLVIDWGEAKLELALQVITGEDVEVLAVRSVGEVGLLALDAALAAALAPDRDPTSLLPAVRAARLSLDGSEAPAAPVEGLDATLARELLERTAAPFLAQASAAIAAVLEAGKLAPASLDARVVAGWPAHAGWVAAALASAAGGPLEPLRQDAVAHGAALFACALEEREAGRPAARISELLGATIGLLHADGSLTRVIEAGTRLPVQKAISIPVSEGAPLALHWFDGEPPSAKTWIGGAQLEPRQSGEAEAFLFLEAGGLLRVELRLPGADRAPVRLERPGEWTDALALAPAPPPRDEAPSSLWSKLRRLVGNR